MTTDLTWMTARPVAHRALHDGNRAVCENSLGAVKRAVDAGYNIEIDVVLAADGEAVMFHDLTLDRMTAETGPVIERSSDDLAAIRLKETGDVIPTLTETLALIDGRVGIVIELKGHDPSNTDLVAAVGRSLSAYSGPAAVMSFDPWLVRAFKAHMPDVPRGLTAEGTARGAIESHFSMLAHDLDFVSYHVLDLPNPFVTFCRDRLSMPVITWTVRDDDAVRKTRDHADQMTFEGFRP